MKTCVYFTGLAALLVCVLGGGQAKVTDCNSHFQCADNEMCVEGKCGDPCQAWGCGANTECRTTNHFKPFCHCKPGYIRSNESDVTSACVECHSHEHCNKGQLCLSNSCQDPCVMNICGKNTTCNVRNQELSCDCLPGHVRTNPAAVTSACRGPRVESAELSVNVGNKDGVKWDGDRVRETRFSVETRDMEVELTRLKFDVLNGVDLTLRIHITSQSDTFTLTHSARSTSYYDYIPLSTQEKPVVLRPRTLYNITFSCDREIVLFTLPSPRYTEPHFHLQFPPYAGGRYVSLVYEIYYKTLTLP